jgi:pimeloyl-ACP methyl ester carboxylesterase
MFLLRIGFCWLVVVMGHATRARAAEPALVTLNTPRGASLSFILVKPENPVATVILFAGGHGALGLKDAETMQWGAGNFLVRTRDRYAADGIAVAVVDAPSDKQQGMNALFRMSKDNVEDVHSLVAHLKSGFGVPVWLVGTSMGTFSAAAAALPGGNADGLVLTSTITRAAPDWAIAQSHPDGVASLALATIDLPTLVVSHRNDGCALTPPTDADTLRQRLSNAPAVEIALIEGELPPTSGPCDAFSPHGYYGAEESAVSVITSFVKRHSRKP